jgi:hypothetical protein
MEVNVERSEYTTEIELAVAMGDLQRLAELVELVEATPDPDLIQPEWRH